MLLVCTTSRVGILHVLLYLGSTVSTYMMYWGFLTRIDRRVIISHFSPHRDATANHGASSREAPSSSSTMRPATIRLLYSILTKLVAVYVCVVLYIFTTIEIEEHHDVINRLENKGADFYARFRRSAALRLRAADGAIDDGPKLPECPLPSPEEGRIPKEPPAPYLLRTGEPKYLPAPKPADESCLRWKSSGGCWEHYASGAKLCRFDDMAFDANKFYVSKGGERPEDVKGRYEEEEMFHADYCAVYLPIKPTFWTQWYQSKLIDVSGVGVPDRSQCDVYLPGLTFLYERIEYANLYHTMTDWFNVHWSLEKLKYKGGNQQLRIIWLDGHAASNLDDAWADIFHANVTYVSQYQGIVCMERTAWLPKNSPVYDIAKDWVQYGFETAQEEQSNCGVMDRFIERVLTAYDVPLDRSIDPSLDLVIDRQPYFAHPRVDMEKAAKDSRTLPDMQELFPDSRVIKLHEMTFREQVELVARAKSLRGVHGAGLTHLLWLPKGSEVVEWQPLEEGFDGNTMFQNLATWVPGVIHRIGPMPRKPKGMLETLVSFLFGSSGENKAATNLDRREDIYEYGRDMVRGGDDFAGPLDDDYNREIQ